VPTPACERGIFCRLMEFEAAMLSIMGSMCTALCICVVTHRLCAELEPSPKEEDKPVKTPKLEDTKAPAEADKPAKEDKPTKPPASETP